MGRSGIARTAACARLPVCYGRTTGCFGLPKGVLRNCPCAPDEHPYPEHEEDANLCLAE